MGNDWTRENNKHQLRKTIALLLLLLASIGIAPIYYNVVTDTERTIGIWSEKVYTLFNNNTALNIPVCFCLTLLATKLLATMLRNTTREPRIDYLRVNNYSLSIILVIVFIKLSDSVKFANLFRDVELDYKRFLLVLLWSLVVLLVSLWSAWVVFFILFRIDKPQWLRNKSNGFTSESKHRNDSRGFSAEGDYELLIPLDLEEYAYSIVERLMHTSLSEESFAVGIISQWGAGKTTFLELLIKQLNKYQAKLDEYQAEVVEFNPWMSSTPEQVTSDFFASLHNQLADKYPELSSPIKQYAKYLSSVSLRLPGLALRFSSFFSEKSLLERKKVLSDKFEKLGKKIVVIIDDVDRLESSEVFEVLRLIRNTADLKNVIYLVAFDKEYVVSILKEKNIDDPIAYLEKIFQVEIRLPMVSSERIMSTLTKELNLKIATEVSGRTKPDFQFRPEEQRLILKVITTYRRAKRFARLYSLNYEHLFRTSFENLEWRDVFWLDLLQLNDKNTYDLILCNNPLYALKTKKRNDETYYIYEDSNDNKELFKDIPYTHDILLKLFGDLGEQDPPQYSIRNTKYYEKYFTMQVRFSNEDFESLLNADNDKIDEIIKEWREKQKPIDNIAQVVYDYNKEEFDKEKVIKLSIVCFSILYYNNSDDVSDSIINVLDEITEKALMDQVELEEQLKICFNNRIEENCDLVKLALITSILWQRTARMAIAQELVETIVDAYFKKNTNCTVLDLKKSNTTIQKILYELPTSLFMYAVNCVIDGYSNASTKPTIFQLRDAKAEENSLYWLLEEYYHDKLQLIEEKCCSNDQNENKQKEKKWIMKKIHNFVRFLKN